MEKEFKTGSDKKAISFLFKNSVYRRITIYNDKLFTIVLKKMKKNKFY